MDRNNIIEIKDCLLLLGSRLADYSHIWTDVERQSFDYVMGMLDNTLNNMEESE